MAQIKTKSEIMYIQKACSITDDIFKKIITFLRHDSKVTEINLKNFISSEIKKKKLRESFPPIVTSGKRAGNEIHPQSTNEYIRGFTIVDFGVRYNGYCSDMTRTLYIGKPSKKDIKIYKEIAIIQKDAMFLVKDNVLSSEIDQHVRKRLGIYKKYFIHTLGHGVGRKIHEPPIIYEKKIKPILKSGMVITIEPGIYIHNRLGIRIEDTLCVQAKKPKILTKSSREMLIF